MQVTITNLTSSPVFINDLEGVAVPVATPIVITRSYGELTAMFGLQKAITDAEVSVALVYSADEIASGLVPPSAPAAPAAGIFQGAYQHLNADYTTAVAKTGGVSVRYLPTATATVAAGAGFTAGVAAVSNPTVGTVGAATFAPGDLVGIDDIVLPANSGLFEVVSHVGNVLTVAGVGTVPKVEDFTEDQFVTDPVLGATITKVTVSVLRVDGAGVWEVGQGSTVPFTFNDLSSLPHATTHENGGGDEVNVGGLSGLLADQQDALAHASRHENGGVDEISVAGLSGQLADQQPVLAHQATHLKGGSDSMDIEALATPGVVTTVVLRPDGAGGVIFDVVPLHAARHENGGPDELSVAGLSGLLADQQTPLSHAATHIKGGSDELTGETLNTASVTVGHVMQTTGANTLGMGLVPVHGTRHENGGADEFSVAGLSGLLADQQTPLAHAASHQDGGSDELNVGGLSGLLGDSQTPLAHAGTHQNGGADELSVAGLSGLLADQQTPLSHAASHSDGGTDEIKIEDLGATSVDAAKVFTPDGSGGVLATDPFLTGLAVGQILHGTAGGGVGQEAELFWDELNNRLGVGVPAPSVALDVAGDAQVSGNLTVQGATFSTRAEEVRIDANFNHLNNNYTTVAGQAGGLTLRYLPTITTDTVSAGGFTAGVAATSDPTIATVGATTFSPGDIVAIDGAANEENNGLVEVVSHIANTLTIRGIGLTATLEAWTDTQLVTDATAGATLTNVHMTVLQANPGGDWEVGKGSATPIVYTDVTEVLAHAATHQNGGADELSVAGLSGLLGDSQTPLAHVATHANGGADELSVAGLSGLLADSQTPLAHVATHANGGADELSVAGLSGLLADSQTPLAHKASHDKGGSDALDVEALNTASTTVGHVLQTTAANTVGMAILPAHAVRHALAGADQLNVGGLSGLLADGQTPLAHKASHDKGGSDALIGESLNTASTTVGHVMQTTAANTLGMAALPGHVATHANGGSDELSVAGLSGLLADGQTPLSHAASHAENAADELLVENLGATSVDTNQVFKPDGTGGIVAGTVSGGFSDSVEVAARKGSAGTINIGQPVYVSGFNVGQTVPEVELADADAAGEMPALGIASQAITNAANTNVTVMGQVSGFDTSAWTVGDLLYISTTAGVLTNSRPTGATSAVQAVGEVLRVHATMGVVLVIGAGRTNAEANLATGFVLEGDGNAHPTGVDPANRYAPAAHVATHANGGGDELSVAGLSGLLADGQTPLSHAASHGSAGGDTISISRLPWNNGATGSRPGAPVLAEPYFDTTLGIPIWYNGTNWIDATGATV